MTFYPDATVWVIGGKPDWYTGNYIPVEQKSNSFKNVRNNLSQIIDHPDIPDEVVVMNDDFFFIKRLDYIPYYISGTLQDKIDLYETNNVSASYVNRLYDLERHCKRFKNPPLDFELHVPIRVNKKMLAKVIDDNVMWRSNYGNRFVQDGEIQVMEDVKVYPDKQYEFKNYDYYSLKYPFVSTQDTSFADVSKNLLRKMFPSKSKHEIK